MASQYERAACVRSAVTVTSVENAEASNPPWPRAAQYQTRRQVHWPGQGRRRARARSQSRRVPPRSHRVPNWTLQWRRQGGPSPKALEISSFDIAFDGAEP